MSVVNLWDIWGGEAEGTLWTILAHSYWQGGDPLSISVKWMPVYWMRSNYCQGQTGKLLAGHFVCGCGCIWLYSWLAIKPDIPGYRARYIWTPVCWMRSNYCQGQTGKLLAGHFVCGCGCIWLYSWLAIKPDIPGYRARYIWTPVCWMRSNYCQAS